MDIFDIQDARLLAETKTKKWMAEFESEYTKPQMEMSKALLWQEFIPPEVKAQLQQRIPGVVKRYDKKYGGR